MARRRGPVPTRPPRVFVFSEHQLRRLTASEQGEGRSSINYPVALAPGPLIAGGPFPLGGGQLRSPLRSPRPSCEPRGVSVGPTATRDRCVEGRRGGAVLCVLTRRLGQVCHESTWQERRVTLQDSGAAVGGFSLCRGGVTQAALWCSPICGKSPTFTAEIACWAMCVNVRALSFYVNMLSFSEDMCSL